MQLGAGEVDATELARGGLTGEHGAAEVDEALHHRCGVRGDPVTQRDGRLGVGPSLDWRQFLDPDRDAAERQ